MVRTLQRDNSNKFDSQQPASEAPLKLIIIQKFLRTEMDFLKHTDTTNFLSCLVFTPNVDNNSLLLQGKERKKKSFETKYVIFIPFSQGTKKAKF